MRRNHVLNQQANNGPTAETVRGEWNQSSFIIIIMISAGYSIKPCKTV